MSISKLPVSVAVIRGGIAGLSAAYFIQKHHPHLETTLFEAKPHLGGTIRTSCDQDFLIEHGPDAFLNAPSMEALIDELGLKDQIISTQPFNRRSYIVKNKTLVRIPKGFYLMGPLRTWPFLASKALSLKAKLRTLLEPWVPVTTLTDESLTDFVSRRFGKANLEDITQALIGGIYTANPDTLSIHATMPKFVAFEQEYGSVLRGMRKEIKGQDIQGPRYGKFRSFKRGMQTLVDHLAQAMHTPSIQLNAKVQNIQRVDSKWVLQSTHGTQTFDHILLGIHPRQILQLMPSHFDATLSARLASFESASSAIVYLAFDKKSFDDRIHAMGMIVPKKENLPLLAATFCSEKFAGRAKESHVLLRVFLGGAQRPGICQESDEALVGMAIEGIQQLLNPGEPHHYHKVIRWPHAMPQYTLGHIKRVQTIFDQIEETGAQMTLLGNAYTGVGIPHLIEQSKKAAQSLLQKHHSSDTVRL